MPQAVLSARAKETAYTVDGLRTVTLDGALKIGAVRPAVPSNNGAPTKDVDGVGVPVLLDVVLCVCVIEAVSVRDWLGVCVDVPVPLALWETLGLCVMDTEKA